MSCLVQGVLSHPSPDSPPQSSPEVSKQGSNTNMMRSFNEPGFKRTLEQCNPNDVALDLAATSTSCQGHCLYLPLTFHQTPFNCVSEVTEWSALSLVPMHLTHKKKTCVAIFNRGFTKNIGHFNFSLPPDGCRTRAIELCIAVNEFAQGKFRVEISTVVGTAGLCLFVAFG